MMDPMNQKLHEAEIALSKQYGDFRLFALLSREDVPGKWDLVASAPWGDKDTDAALRLLIDHLKSILDHKEITSIPRVIWFDPHDPGLGEMLTKISSGIRVTGHSIVMIEASVINGVAIDQAVLFACDDTI